MICTYVHDSPSRESIQGVRSMAIVNWVTKEHLLLIAVCGSQAFTVAPNTNIPVSCS